jgi:fermentation-respiration switch protein FrsA (DUF1100 family)
MKHMIPRKSSKLVITVTLVCFVAWLVLSASVRIYANNIIFHPLKTYYTYPGIPDYTQYFVVNSQQNKIDMRYYQGQKSEALIIYFHGNGGFSMGFLPDLLKQGNVLVPSYPGYLQSEGEPKVDNFYEIGDLAYQKALDLGYREDQIILWGHSLGGAEATYVSSKHPNLDKTILINTFNNIQSVCEKRLYIFCIFGGQMLPSDTYAAQIKGKVRHFHDRGDTTIPFELGQRLYDKIGSADKKFTTFETGDHNHFDIPKTFIN